MTAAEPAPTLTVLVFSHRPEVRESITTAVGRRPAPDLPRVRFREVGTIADVLAAGEVDLAILDGEAQPTGGIGLARQLKDEIEDCPPMIIAVRRRDDRWLARWSQAEAVLMHPLDPLTVADRAATHSRSGRCPARMTTTGTSGTRGGTILMPHSCPAARTMQDEMASRTPNLGAATLRRPPSRARCARMLGQRCRLDPLAVRGFG